MIASITHGLRTIERDDQEIEDLGELVDVLERQARTRVYLVAPTRHGQLSGCAVLGAEA